MLRILIIDPEEVNTALTFLLLRKTSLRTSVSIFKHYKIYDENVNSVCVEPASVSHRAERKTGPLRSENG